MNASATPTPRHPAGFACGVGFTLVELVLVLTILAAASAIAVPRFAASLAGARLRAASTQVAARLAFAREAAAAASTPVSVTFDPSAGTAAFGGLPPGLTDEATDRFGTATLDLAASPFGVEVVAANFHGSAEIGFDAFGEPSAGGFVELASAGVTRRISIRSGTGAVEVGP